MTNETEVDLEGACKEWIIAGAVPTRELAASNFAGITDRDLATDMIEGWFSEPDPDGDVYGSDGPPTVEDATKIFAGLRDLEWLDNPEED